MSKEKAARRKQAGGAMDPYAMSMQMGPVPGAPQGPGNINNNGIRCRFQPTGNVANVGAEGGRIFRTEEFRHSYRGPWVRAQDPIRKSPHGEEFR